MVCPWCLLPILHFYSSSYFLHKASKKVGRLLTAGYLAKTALTCAATSHHQLSCNTTLDDQFKPILGVKIQVRPFLMLRLIECKFWCV
jgi:hypothetical protein